MRWGFGHDKSVLDDLQKFDKHVEKLYQLVTPKPGKDWEDSKISGTDTSETGRKEILLFFYLYAVIEILAFFLDSNIIPSANVAYPVRLPCPSLLSPALHFDR